MSQKMTNIQNSIAKRAQTNWDKNCTHHVKTAAYTRLYVAAPKGCDLSQLTRDLDAVVEKQAKASLVYEAILIRYTSDDICVRADKKETRRLMR